MDIAIDFDGTCVTHEYPDTGKDIGAVPVLKRLIEEDHNLILFTMRSGQGLEEAIKWFAVKGLRLYGVQYNPTQAKWTASNKCYAHLYIDDAALGCPIRVEGKISKRPFVDWPEVERILERAGLLPETK